jgi:hypothetical protein
MTRSVTLLFAMVLAARAAAGQGLTPIEAEVNKSSVTFYGLARFDLIFDDSRPSSFQTPTFIRSEAAGAENRGNLTMHPRLTRFGVNYRAPQAPDGPAAAGRLEFDFQNGGSNSRALPRYRQAFLQLTWGAHSLLAGQTADIISPLFPTVSGDTLMWNAGNLGDRRPQLRYGYEPPAGLNVRAGIGLTGAIDNLDADANSVPDGEAALLPTLQGRVGYSAPGGRVFLGLWGHYARMRTDSAIGGETRFDGHSVGGDVDVRLSPQVNVRGEAWRGKNLGDVRGGIGQAFNITTGGDIESAGGWVELGLRSGPYGFSTGYTIDNPEDEDVPDAGAIDNRAWYVTNQFRVAQPVVLGIDYLFWRTRFNNANDGTDNRVNLYFIYTY